MLKANHVRRKSQNTRELKNSQQLVPCESFSVGLENVVRIRDKMQFVYKEMAHDGAKSNAMKFSLWNPSMSEMEKTNPRVADKLAKS